MPRGNDAHSVTVLPWSLDEVKAAPTQDVRHLGLGRYVLLESEIAAAGPPARAVAQSGSPGFERLVARVLADDAILDAIGMLPAVKVARCSSSGEPSSLYIRCEAVVLPPEDRGNSEFLINLGLGWIGRLRNRVKPGDYAVIELTPIKPGEPATAAAPPKAPDAPSEKPLPGQAA